MDTGTTRMGSRSSTRHGPVTVFTGRVRKWQKKWARSGATERIQVYKWVPLTPAPASAAGNREEEPEQLRPHKVKYVPVSIMIAKKQEEAATAATEASLRAAEKNAEIEKAAQKAKEEQNEAKAITVPDDDDAMEVETAKEIEQVDTAEEPRTATGGTEADAAGGVVSILDIPPTSQAQSQPVNAEMVLSPRKDSEQMKGLSENQEADDTREEMEGKSSDGTAAANDGENGCGASSGGDQKSTSPPINLDMVL